MRKAPTFSSHYGCPKTHITGHCDVAQGYPQAPANSHAMAPLIEWVERNIKPKSVLASDPPDGSGRTRKLCPWPQTAKYKSGNKDDWESFVCV